ncbi:hypothetical protein F4779DRAFT_241644 [Xylariaceae sp. FL0662B]|nr:hypothetical protein F4779DRAFT_241644 [Xylariaceae sp. FL0662B]
MAPDSDPATQSGLCDICQDPENTQEFASLPCGHKFHYGCIDKWLGMGVSTRHCPYCRRNLVHPDCGHRLDSELIKPCAVIRQSDISPRCNDCRPRISRQTVAVMVLTALQTFTDLVLAYPDVLGFDNIANVTGHLGSNYWRRVFTQRVKETCIELRELLNMAHRVFRSLRGTLTETAQDSAETLPEAAAEAARELRLYLNDLFPEVDYPFASEIEIPATTRVLSPDWTNPFEKRQIHVLFDDLEEFLDAMGPDISFDPVLRWVLLSSSSDVYDSERAGARFHYALIWGARPLLRR